MSWFDAARTRARLLVARRAAEARVNDELAFHLEMETARRVREQGLDIDEARIVHLRNWDVQANQKEPRALHDFVVWRQARFSWPTRRSCWGCACSPALSPLGTRSR